MKLSHISYVTFQKLIAVLALAYAVANEQNGKPGETDSAEDLSAGTKEAVDEMLQEAFQKLQRKQLVTRVMHKPVDCTVLSEVGDEMQVHYTGYLASGEIFDSSIKSGKDPIKFKLGSGQVIAGWDQGLQNMCEGEKRRLIIPPELGYGAAGFPPVIPADATLLFEATLVHLTKKGETGGIGDLLQNSQLLVLLITPAVVSFIFYYLCKRYKEDTLAAKEKKHSGGSRKNRKRK